MKKCKCEHWQTCPVCYPQGFDEAGNRKPVEIPPTRDEMLARIKELEAERDALKKLSQQSNQDHLDRAIQREKERLTAFEQIDSLKDEVTLLQRIAGEDQAEIDTLKQDRGALLKDAERLDYLDGNIRFKMGWYVGEAPVGNICVSSVIQPSGKTTRIREAIDAAIAARKEGKS